MIVRRCDIRTARIGCARVHRHRSRPPPSGLVAFEAVVDGWPRGWALVGRPASPALQLAGWVEVTRCAVEEGTPNACSALYGAAARWAGHRDRRHPISTYTLVRESGASLRAAGWVVTARVDKPRGKGWNNRGGRAPTLWEPKLRWAPPLVALGLAFQAIAEAYRASR